MIEITQNENDEWVLFVSAYAAKNRDDAFVNYDSNIPEWQQEYRGVFGENTYATLREAVEALSTALPDLREDI